MSMSRVDELLQQVSELVAEAKAIHEAGKSFVSVFEHDDLDWVTAHHDYPESVCISQSGETVELDLGGGYNFVELFDGTVYFVPNPVDGYMMLDYETIHRLSNYIKVKESE